MTLLVLCTSHHTARSLLVLHILILYCSPSPHTVHPLLVLHTFLWYCGCDSLVLRTLSLYCTPSLYTAHMTLLYFTSTLHTVHPLPVLYTFPHYCRYDSPGNAHLLLILCILLFDCAPSSGAVGVTCLFLHTLALSSYCRFDSPILHTHSLHTNLYLVTNWCMMGVFKL